MKAGEYVNFLSFGKHYDRYITNHSEFTVLDHDNHPLRIFPDLPLTLSSEIEGWYLEAVMRLDGRKFPFIADCSHC